MTYKEFDKIIEQQLNNCKKILKSKGVEYNINTDRLEYFKVAGAMLHLTPEQALVSFMTKHIISIIDMARNKADYSIELWEEKITDTINYLILLRGLVEELNQDEVE